MPIPAFAIYRGERAQVLQYLDNGVFLVLDSKDTVRTARRDTMKFLPGKTLNPGEPNMSINTTGVDLTFEVDDDGNEVNPFKVAHNDEAAER